MLLCIDRTNKFTICFLFFPFIQTNIGVVGLLINDLHLVLPSIVPLVKMNALHFSSIKYFLFYFSINLFCCLPVGLFPFAFSNNFFFCHYSISHCKTKPTCYKLFIVFDHHTHPSCLSNYFICLSLSSLS